jgi:hypothetical protein
MLWTAFCRAGWSGTAKVVVVVVVVVVDVVVSL